MSRPGNPLPRALRLAAALVSTAAMVSPVPAAAQTYGRNSQLMGAPASQAELLPANNSQTVAVDLSGPNTPVRTLALPRGKSATIDLPTDARDVVLSDPKVADVVLSTPRRIYVVGMGAGQTDAAFMDAYGRQILRLNIRVDQDVSALGDTLNRLIPGASIRAEPVNESVVLTGEVPNAAAANNAMRLAAAFVTKSDHVVNMLSVSESEQVTLRVRVVEVNRSVIKQLGFNLGAVTGQLGMPQYSFMKAPTYGVNGSFLGSGSSGYSVNTTSQPVSGNPVGNLFSGVSGGLLQTLQSAGLSLASVPAAVSNYLAGTGSLTTAQSSAVSQYLNGALSTTSTNVTTAAGYTYTVTAASAGITSSNLQQMTQAYLKGSSTLTGDQQLWLNAFYKNLPSYNNTTVNDLSAAQNSLVADRSNPADPVATGRAGSTGLNQANAMLQAFERTGLVRTLAEPNLTAVSGESASFLAGGEFPVPVGQDNNGRVTVEFKKYGVGLGFTPVVLSRGRISIKVSTEVSELSQTGGFTVGSSAAGSTTSASLVIPGLNVRRAETTAELPSGGSMMIAGLLQSSAKETLDSLPGVQNLPVLGALFRSRDYVNNETELVIIITPYLVKPTTLDKLQTPADGLQIASDIETNLLGHLNTSFGKSPAAAKPGAYQGPIGYVID